MEIVAAARIPAVRIVTPRRFVDERGFFSEVWRKDAFRQAGMMVDFVQDNHSLSRLAGTIRGLHFQTGAKAQAKLVRCIRGSILDVAVDIRHGSPSFGQHVAVVLSAENWRQVYIPVGFAHAFCTLEPDAEVAYKTSAHYDPENDCGLAWDDTELRIDWPVTGQEAVLSPRDRTHPRLAELPPFFPYSRYPD
jgi:dTDP-4-dehydrorhamnose 3,5-epimerase